jgi:hypothetical protein
VQRVSEVLDLLRVQLGQGGVGGVDDLVNGSTEEVFLLE